MKTFQQFVDTKNLNLIKSFEYIGRNLDQFNESTDDELLKQPQSQSAVSFIQNIAHQISDSAKTGIDFIKSLADKSAEEIKKIIKEKLSYIETQFNKTESSLKQRKEKKNESIIGDVGNFAYKGIEFLIEKLLIPPLRLLKNNFLLTGEHILASIVGAGRSLGAQGFFAAIILTALTVAVWPVFAAISVAALGTTGTTWAIGGGMFGVWLCILAMAWFKANVLGPAMMKGEGINPPGGVAYGI